MKSVLSYFFGYKGRIGRIQFIASIVVWATIGITLALGYRSIFGDLYRSESHALVLTDKAVGIIGVAVCFWTFFSSWVKRCHDLGWTGLCALLILIPAANSIFFLFMIFKRGEEKPNAWGDIPKTFEV